MSGPIRWHGWNEIVLETLRRPSTSEDTSFGRAAGIVQKGVLYIRACCCWRLGPFTPQNYEARKLARCLKRGGVKRT